MCELCGKSTKGRYNITGFHSPLCEECHSNLMKLRQGKGNEAKGYFDAIINNGTPSASRFVMAQYNEYNLPSQINNSVVDDGYETESSEGVYCSNASKMIWPNVLLWFALAMDVLSIIGYLIITEDMPSQLKLTLFIALVIETSILTLLSLTLKEIANHIEKIERNLL